MRHALRRTLLALVAVGALAVVLASAGTASAYVITFTVEPAQTVQSRLDMVDATNVQAMPVTGTITADITITPDVSGPYVSSFQALGGELVLSAGQPVLFALNPPITTCFGSGGDFCDPASGYCTETAGGVPGESLVTAAMFGFKLTPGGAALPATLTTPGQSDFTPFDPANPDPDDNFKLTTTAGNFLAEGCALNQIVDEQHNFGPGGRISDFWGFTGTGTLGVSGETVDLSLPLNHNLLVIGWDGTDDNYGIMNLAGNVVLVPEPGVVLLFCSGALLLGLIRRFARSA